MKELKFTALDAMSRRLRMRVLPAILEKLDKTPKEYKPYIWAIYTKDGDLHRASVDVNAATIVEIVDFSTYPHENTKEQTGIVLVRIIQTSDLTFPAGMYSFIALDNLVAYEEDQRYYQKSENRFDLEID